MATTSEKGVAPRPEFARVKEGRDGSSVLSLLHARPRLAARFHGPSGQFLSARGPVDALDPLLDTVWDICHGGHQLWQPWYEDGFAPLLQLSRQLKIPPAPVPELQDDDERFTGYQDAEDRHDSRFPALPWLARRIPWPGADLEHLVELAAENHHHPFEADLLAFSVCGRTETALVSLRLAERKDRVVMLDLMDHRLYWLRPCDFQRLIHWLEALPASSPRPQTPPLWLVVPVLC